MSRFTVYQGKAYPTIKKAEENGNYMAFSCFAHNESESTKKVRKMFKHNKHKNLNSYFNKALKTMENLISECECEFDKITLYFQHSECNIDYLIVFDKDIFIHLSVNDQYHGQGEYELSISAEGLIVPENVSQAQVDEIEEFFKRNFVQ